MLDDLRYAFRQLAKNPSFTIIAIFALAGVGTLIGLAAAAGLSRVMASLLFGVSATDVVTFAAVPALLMATAMLAGCVPARRATRVDPVAALRYE